MRACNHKRRIVIKGGIREAEIRQYNELTEKLRPKIAKWQRVLREDFIEGVKEITGRRVQKADLEPELVVDRAVDWGKLKDDTKEAVRPAVFDIADQSGQRKFKQIGEQMELETGVFNLFNEKVKRYAETRAGAMVTQINNSTRQAIQREVTRALEEGVTGTRLAGRLDPYVGMHSRQINALHNYRDDLIDKGFSGSELEKKVNLESKRKLRYRRRLIADTETAKSRIHGQVESFRSAKIKKVTPVLGSRPCPICIGLVGEYTPAEANGIYPVHPDCDCTLVTSQVVRDHPPNYSGEVQEKIEENAPSGVTVPGVPGTVSGEEAAAGLTGS